MDLRRMSNWNVLNVEAALQQLNYQEKENDGFVIIVPRSTTVRVIVYQFLISSKKYLEKFLKI